MEKLFSWHSTIFRLEKSGFLKSKEAYNLFAPSLRSKVKWTVFRSQKWNEELPENSPKPVYFRDFDLSKIRATFDTMDNQINFITPDRGVQNGQLNFNENIQITRPGACPTNPGQTETNCEKCNFHEATCLDINLGPLCQKCFEWFC